MQGLDEKQLGIFSTFFLQTTNPISICYSGKKTGYYILVRLTLYILHLRSFLDPKSYEYHAMRMFVNPRSLIQSPLGDNQQLLY